MPRMARLVVPGYPHHITQRGVRSMDIFSDDQDRQLYLEYLDEEAGRFGVIFYAWCLMTNHVHLVAVPEEEGSLARAIGEAHRRYTRMKNFSEGVRGYLFQGIRALLHPWKRCLAGSCTLKRREGLVIMGNRYYVPRFQEFPCRERGIARPVSSAYTTNP